MKTIVHRRLAIAILLTLLLAILYTPKVHAESLTLEPTKDTYVDAAYPNSSYGTIGLGNVGYQPVDSTRKAVLLQFDTSTIPTGAIIDNAKLTMRIGGCIGSDPSLGNMSFNAYLSLGGTNWSNTSTFNQIGSSGGSLELLYSKIVPCSSGSYVDFDAKELTQLWVDGVIPNDGIVLNPATSSTYWTRVFYMKEATAASRPKLEINYTIPYEEVTSPDGGIPIPAETSTTETIVKAQSVSQPISPDESLNPPTKLSATILQDSKNIKLTWDKSNSENVEKYRIYRLEVGAEGIDKKIGEVTADNQQFVDENTESGKTYSYFIRSVRNNLESNNSDIVIIEVEKSKDNTLPTQEPKDTKQQTIILATSGLALITLATALAVLALRQKKLHKKHKELLELNKTKDTPEEKTPKTLD